MRFGNNDLPCLVLLPKSTTALVSQHLSVDAVLVRHKAPGSDTYAFKGAALWPLECRPQGGIPVARPTGKISKKHMCDAAPLVFVRPAKPAGVFEAAARMMTRDAMLGAFVEAAVGTVL